MKEDKQKKFSIHHHYSLWPDSDTVGACGCMGALAIAVMSFAFMCAVYWRGWPW